MFDFVVSIGGKSFLPIDVNIAPPMPAPLPDEIRSKLNDCDIEWFMPIHMDVENVSSESICNVRIKFPHKMLYTPVWANRDHLRKINAHYDEEAAEIAIDRIDPGDRFYVAAFPHDDHVEHFNEKNIQVLIDGKKISKLQKEAAFFVRKPLFGLAILCMFLALFGSVIFAIYVNHPTLFSKESDLAMIERARARMGGYCKLDVVKVNSMTAQSIAFETLPVEYLLFINGSTNKSELLSREKIVICTPID